MNSKVINIFTVCLITLSLFFPSLMVFGLVWEKHLNFVEKQQNNYLYHQNIQSECSAIPQQISSVTNDNFYNLSPSINETNLKLSSSSRSLHLWRWLFLFLPFCIGVVIFIYDRYLVYRANLFQQQVEMLEKLWQQSLEK